ncbi:MAG: glycosyltransferase, partial [Chloroflexi bacterium]|nr:glycosyltransferase [Chloroflexota bacterium]
MRRVLIIAYYFPPRPAVASLRPLGLAKYLPEFGWEAVILTAALPGKPDPHFKVIETQYHDCLGFAKRLLKLDSQAPLLTQVRNKLKIRSETSFLDFILAAAAGIIAYPDPQKGWQRFAIEAGRDILRQQNIHAMVSSSPPQTSHIIARKLKDEFQIPWVADFHDLWTQNYYYLYGPLRRVIERRLELSTLSTADALVTVSQPMADDLRSLHKRNDVYSILYGFDPAEVSATPVKLTAKFTITYT